jgi:membrane protein YdbS with pleckstrin-like domain
MTPEPSRRLAPSARWLWRAQGLIATVPAIVAASVMQGLWVLLPVAVLALGVVLLPELRWSRWRYEVRDAEIDLRHGTVRITRTLVPMLRVQHVDTTRGPLDQLLGLATVVVHTAAGTTTIPALETAEAGHLRDRIAALARTADEL